MNQGIHPAGLAEINIHRAGQKYRPSNGTEGDCFFAAWCWKCARDNQEEDERCEILGRTFDHNVEDPEYPSEWQYGKDGQPTCIAFRNEDDPVPPTRCPLTVDMFEQGGAA